MSIYGENFIQYFEQYCPQFLAEHGDPVGLHIGTLKKEVQRVMVTLDVRPEVVQEAIEKKVDLLIAKHPPIFSPIERLTTDYPQQNMYADLLKHDIAVYAAHTNLDIIPNGLNDWLCTSLEVKETQYLQQTHTFIYQKLSIHVPRNQMDTMTAILLKIGEEDFLTRVGKFEVTPIHEEEKIEVIFPKNSQEKILSAITQTDQIESFVYELSDVESENVSYGIGRIGELDEPISLLDFCEKIKQTFDLEGLKIISNKKNPLIKKVAICGGSGEKFYSQALRQNADVYITGDVYYHTAHDMLADGLNVVDPGHYIESICKHKLVELFNQWKKEENWTVDFMESTVNTDPFQLYV